MRTEALNAQHLPYALATSRPKQGLVRVLAVGLAAGLILAGCATTPAYQGDTEAGANGPLPYLAAILSSGKNRPLPNQPLTAVDGNTGPRTASTEAVIQAIAQLGTPYDWGGMSTEEGFDCSGLTTYIYREANIDLPRTARSQYRATKHISRKNLKPGDLVFFRLHSRHVDHVGIYIGDDRFIHAPRRGKNVSFAELTNSYWSRHFVTGGRVRGAHALEIATNP